MKKYTLSLVLTLFVSAFSLVGCSSTPVSETESAIEGGDISASDQSALDGLAEADIAQASETPPPATETPSAPEATVTDGGAPTATGPLYADASGASETQRDSSPVDLGASSAGRSH